MNGQAPLCSANNIPMISDDMIRMEPQDGWTHIPPYLWLISRFSLTDNNESVILEGHMILHAIKQLTLIHSQGLH